MSWSSKIMTSSISVELVSEPCGEGDDLAAYGIELPDEGGDLAAFDFDLPDEDGDLAALDFDLPCENGDLAAFDSVSSCEDGDLAAFDSVSSCEGIRDLVAFDTAKNNSMLDIIVVKLVVLN